VQRQRARVPSADALGDIPGMMTRLRISGMSCQRCVQAVFTALTPVEGIVSAQVTIGGAVIEHDGRATVEALREAIAVSGYEVSLADEDRRTLPVV
jgi:copper chaperone CopZ